jgi:NDP-sugar pyrophosphorylase family protein
VVADRPKVLAEVAGRPFLTYLLKQLADAGLRKTVLLTGYAADQVKAAFGGSFAGMQLAYSAETQPLGTGGALRLALPYFDQPTVLLMNGDSYCDSDLRGLARFHFANRAEATLTLTQVPDVSRYGRVVLNDDRRIVRFEEKGGSSAPGWINAGIYLFNRDCIESIPADQAVSLERDVLPSWVKTGEVSGFPAGKFIDIGTPESYAEATAFFAAHSSRRD